MPTYTEQTDRTKYVVITPRLTRAFWSRQEAFPGDELKLLVETVDMPDGTPIRFEIWEQDANEDDSDDLIAELDDGYTISANRCTIDYVLPWEDEALDQELDLEGDELEYYFVAIVDNFELKRRSNILPVNIAGFVFSC